MAYAKQSFVDEEVLHAHQLNHMEDGIEYAFNAAEQLEVTAQDLAEVIRINSKDIDAAEKSIKDTNESITAIANSLSGYADKDYVGTEINKAKMALAGEDTAIRMSVLTLTQKQEEMGEVLKTVADTQYVDDKVAALVSELVDSSPETLNTLNELSEALGNDPNFATSIATEIGKKADKTALDGLTDTVFEESRILNKAFDELSAKVDEKPNQTDLDGLAGYIQEKADQTDVDKLYEMYSSLESDKVVIDSTLKNEGEAADAKEVGERIDAVTDAVYRETSTISSYLQELDYVVVRVAETAKQMDDVLALANTYYNGFYFMYIGETTEDGRYVNGQVYKINERPNEV